MTKNCRMCHKKCDTCQTDCKPFVELNVTDREYLRMFTIMPYYPLAFMAEEEYPVGPDFPDPNAGIILCKLKDAGLISLDRDFPLEGFNYRQYEGYTEYGSAGVTELGKQVLEWMEYQGISK